jgi:hypothetical protein
MIKKTCQLGPDNRGGHKPAKSLMHHKGGQGKRSRQGKKERRGTSSRGCQRERSLRGDTGAGGGEALQGQIGVLIRHPGILGRRGALTQVRHVVRLYQTWEGSFQAGYLLSPPGLIRQAVGVQQPWTMCLYDWYGKGKKLPETAYLRDEGIEPASPIATIQQFRNCLRPYLSHSLIRCKFRVLFASTPFPSPHPIQSSTTRSSPFPCL